LTGLFGRGENLITALAAAGRFPGQDYDWVHNWPEDVGPAAYAESSFVIKGGLADQLPAEHPFRHAVPMRETAGDGCMMRPRSSVRPR
jgi:hypothetical protein